MQDYKYNYELSEDEVIEYYQYIVKSLPRNLRLKLWIRISIPLLAIFTLIFFKLWPEILYDGIAAIVIFLWLTIGGEWIWRQLIMLRVDKDFLKGLNITAFKKINLSFKDTIIIDGHSISYQQLKDIFPLKKSLIFFYNEAEAFILPLRVIGEEEQIKELYRAVLLKKEAVLK